MIKVSINAHIYDMVINEVIHTDTSIYKVIIKINFIKILYTYTLIHITLPLTGDLKHDRILLLLL